MARGWPLPRASIQGTLPWTPCPSKRALLRQLLSQIIAHARSRGLVLLIPTLRKLRLCVSERPAATIRSVLRTSSKFYRSVDAFQPCLCDRYPDLPRLPSPDGRAHIFAPQDSWAWPPELEFMRTLPAHTAVAPSLDCLTVASQLLARKVVEQLGIPAGDDLIDEVSHPVSTALFDSIRKPP